MNDLEQRIDELLCAMTLWEKASLLGGASTSTTTPVERLGVPSIATTDGPHGARKSAGDMTTATDSTCTAFPTGTAMGAGWNPELLEEVGKVLGRECLAKGAHVLLGPTVNIIRHPLAGRTFECISEDPCLAARIGAAWVRGIQSMGVAACPKHYACNSQELERFRSNSVVDERTIREIYLPAFEACVREAGAWSIMCSYNRVNGRFLAQNGRLLTKILKEQWGFDGVVLTDWGACHSTIDSIRAGLDLEMPGPAMYFQPWLLADGVETWQFDGALLDEAARRVLRLVLRTTDGAARHGPGEYNTPHNQALARRLAEESVTLLKNERDVLPIEREMVQTVAVLGPNAEPTFHTGGGSGAARGPYRVSVFDGLREQFGADVELVHEAGCDNYSHLLPPVPAEWLTPADGAGQGLTAEYFDNAHLRGTPTTVRLDSQVNCWWRQTEWPAQGEFSVRWSGGLRVPRSGRYRFGLDHTCAVELCIDDTRVIGSKVGERPPSGMMAKVHGEMVLEAGKVYPVVLAFCNMSPQMYPHCKFMGARIPSSEEARARLDRAAQLAAQADAAVVVVGGIEDSYESEGHDRLSLDLPGYQNELVERVAASNSRTIVVVNTGAPIAMPWVERVPAIVQGWYGGQEVGRAIAEVLTGTVNPSGKLPMSFPRRIEDTPAFESYPGDRDVVYGERIYVGYRWYDRRSMEVLFAFGHGLSYTSFEFGELQCPATVRSGEAFEVSLAVRNSGGRDGAEVVQLYVSDPVCTVDRPVRELRAFAKVFLKAGECVTVKLALGPRELSYYDPARADWVAEPGEYVIAVGAGSRDIRQQASIRLEE